jgi:hypothetical protein
MREYLAACLSTIQIPFLPRFRTTAAKLGDISSACTETLSATALAVVKSLALYRERSGGEKFGSKGVVVPGRSRYGDLQ